MGVAAGGSRRSIPVLPAPAAAYPPCPLPARVPFVATYPQMMSAHRRYQRDPSQGRTNGYSQAASRGKGAAYTVVLCFLCSFCSYGQQMPPSYALTSDTMAAAVLPPSSWQVLSDATGRLSLKAVLQARGFQDTDRRLDYRNHVYWLRFGLVNRMPRTADIALPAEAAHMDVYWRPQHGRWQHARTGTAVQWSRRDGLKRIPAISLSIDPGEEITVYERLYWDYLSVQPDTLQVRFTGTVPLIYHAYVRNDYAFMRSIQDAFLLGLSVLSFIISLYFFLVVREREFLVYSLFLLVFCMNCLSSLNGVFLREYPQFLLYLYLFSSCLGYFLLIQFLRYFLKTFQRYPRWDKWVLWYSLIEVPVLLACDFGSSILKINLSAASHTLENCVRLTSSIVVLVTAYVYLKEKSKPVRLLQLAVTPICLLSVIAYLQGIILHLHYSRFGAPARPDYVTSFNKAAFIILIASYLWMMAFINWILFRRFSDIRRELARQSIAEQMKSRFFANISHEFRTPLTLIMAPLEDLLHNGDLPQFSRLVPEMHRNAKRLLQLINQLLDLSRINVGKLAVQINREDVVPFVLQTVHSFSSPAERKQIALRTAVSPGLEERLSRQAPAFRFDEDILEKILVNLLSNALRYTPAGGCITVSIGLETTERYLELKVEDTGEGIPPEALPHVFDRFYQAGARTAGVHEGAGIGLALVRELVVLLHGSIFVSSEIAKGTTFRCLLPVNQPQTVSGPAYSARQAPAAAESGNAELFVAGGDDGQTGAEEDSSLILVVEDHTDVRKYLREKLQAGYRISEAADGREGWEKAVHDTPDLIISDVMMPEMDGFQLCKRLKTDMRTSHIPVILLTARAEDTDKMAGLQTGADAYLIKPFNSRELLVRTKNLIAVRNRMRAKFSEKLVVRPHQIAARPREKVFVEGVLAAVEKHIDDGSFSVEALAGEMHMSISQLNRKLKAIVNQTAQQFIRSVRMQRAMELLRTQTATVSEAAWQVGFEDPGYFTKVFKSYFGCLPSERDSFPGRL
jgi:signal transduction histidine kinase/DNA-binding response OmpR family regulator